MNKIHSVKQAAKILGVSTNTMYKYLNEGRVLAARGQARGTFKIPTKSLEKFLGGPLPEEASAQASPDNPPGPLRLLRRPTNEPVIIHVTPPTLTVKTVRLLLIAALILIIFDILLTPRFSFGNQIVRLALIAVLSVLSYQFGGFVKR